MKTLFKLKMLALLILLINYSYSTAQTNTFPSSGAAGIGTTTPNASSLFEVKSTSQGVLIPRMTKTQRDAIVTPATGLLIYQTNSTPGFYYYSGTAWTAVSAKGANTSLSNLVSPTAINMSLFPNANNTLDLGSSSFRWKDLNLYNLKFSDGTTQTTSFIPYVSGTGINISGNVISSVETDPKVATTTSNAVPKWNGSALVDGLIKDNGTNIGVGTATPNASSLLDLSSTTTGILVPRMTMAQRDAIASPAVGLLIFQTTNTPGFYYYSGTAWTAVSAKGANTSLSNLAATTSINSSLLPNANNTLNLGSATLRFKDVNLYNLKFSDGTTQTTSFIPYVAGSGINISGNTISGVESDPKVASSASNAIPKWNGTALVDGIINDNGSNVGIGTTTPGSSALLDVNSTTKGFLVPRMTTAQRDAIASPDAGLQVYNLDDKVINTYDGSSWSITPVYTQTSTFPDPSGPVTWTEKAAFGGVVRSQAVGFSIGNKGYIGTGTSNGTMLKDFWEYNPETNAWTQKSDFGGVARQAAVGFSIGTKGYIGTGLDGAVRLKDFWEYDPVANAWTQKTDFGGTARYGAAGFSIDNKGYVGTGQDGTWKRDFWEYNPLTNTWTQIQEFGGAGREVAASFTIGSKGYLGTGYDGGTSLKDFWEYDPATNAWTQRADFGGNERHWAFGFSLQGFGYVGLGLYGSWHNDFWKYDPTSDDWTQETNFGGSSRGAAVGFSVGDEAYVGTGTNGGTTYNDFWKCQQNSLPVYSSTTIDGSGAVINDGIWSKRDSTVYNSNTGNLGIGVDVPEAKLDVSSTSQGFLMPRMTTTQRDAIASPVCGLQVFNLDEKCVDVYDGSSWTKTYTLQQTGTGDVPGSNSWSQIYSIPMNPRVDAVGFAIGNSGYVGTGFYPSFLNDFMRYNTYPTGNWSVRPPFAGTARYLAIAFSIGNKGYIGTGYDDGGAKNDLWEYDPETESWTQKSNFGGGPRHDAVAFVIGSKGYVGTGRQVGTYYKDFWEYDPVANTWSQKTDFGGTERYGAVAFAIGNKGYIGTGSDIGLFKKDFWEYDPQTNAWTQKSDFGGVARIGAVGFSIGNKGYIGTGAEAIGRLKDFWEYDPAANIWIQRQDVGGTTRSGAVAFVIGSKGYVGTGFSGTGYLADFWEYAPLDVEPIYDANNSLQGSIINDSYWSSAGTYGIYNSSDGNVGIGTPVPNQKLQVSNGITLGSYTTSGWVHSSDEKLKTNIKPIERSLDKILKLQGVSFNWKDASSSNPQIGFIAQEVEKVFPEVVVKDSAGNYAMAPQNLTAPIIEAIKEQQQQITARDETIASQQQQINDLALKLDQFEATLTACCNSNQGNANDISNDGFAEIDYAPSTDVFMLGQNVPNPFDNSTLIPFRIPKDCDDAYIMIVRTGTSEVVAVIPIACSETHLRIEAGTLASGTYSYSLYVNGRLADTKEMILTK